MKLSPPEALSPSPFSIRQMTRRMMSATLPRDRFVVHGARKGDAVCLTFDDGPHPDHTPRLLDVLRATGVVATFFLIGSHAQQFPEVVRRIVAEGHELAQHSFHHRDPSTVSAAVLIEEMKETAALLRDITGIKPTLFRPPHGKLTPAKLLLLWRERQPVVLWNVDPRDYTHQSVEPVKAYFQSRPLVGGDIVLLHDTLPLAAEFASLAIAAARESRLRCVTVSEALGVP